MKDESDNSKHFPREMLLAGAASNVCAKKTALPPYVNWQPNASGSFREASSLDEIKEAAHAAMRNIAANFPRN